MAVGKSDGVVKHLLEAAVANFLAGSLAVYSGRLLWTFTVDVLYLLVFSTPGLHSLASTILAPQFWLHNSGPQLRAYYGLLYSLLCR